MNIIIAIPLLITNIWLLKRSIDFKTYDVLLWALLLVFFSIPYMSDVLLHADSISEEVLFKSGLSALFFNMVFSVVICITVPEELSAPSLSTKSRKFKFLLLLFLCISCALFILHLISVFGLNFLNINTIFYMSFRDVGLDNGTIFRDLFHRISAVAAVALPVYWFSRNYFLTIIAFQILFFCILLEGTRWLLIPALGPLLYGFVFRSNSVLRAFLRFAIIGFTALFLVFHVQTLRYSGDRSPINVVKPAVLADTFVRVFDFGASKETASGEYRLRHFYYFIAGNVPNKYDFSYGSTYLRMLLVGVPTSMSMGLKPIDLTRNIAEWIYPERAGFGGTVHPLIYGESYANFGFMYFVLGGFWAFFIGLLSRYVARQRQNIQILLLPSMASFTVLLARGAVYSAFLFLVTGFLLVLIMKFVARLSYTTKENR